MAFNGLEKEPLEASYKPISNTAKDANFFWLESLKIVQNFFFH